MRSRLGHVGEPEVWPSESLLWALSAASRDALLALGRPHRCEGGHPLILEGSTDTYVVLLVNACVKVTAVTADGQVTLLAIRHSGDLVGELAGLDSRPRLATVTTVGAALVRLIPRSEFLMFLRQHPEVAVALSRRVAEKLRATTRRRVDFGGVPVSVRLCRLMAEMATEDGIEQATGSSRVHLTQHELAMLVGAAEVSVSRGLRELVRDGVLRTGYRWVEICDRAALRRIADGGPRPRALRERDDSSDDSVF